MQIQGLSNMLNADKTVLLNVLIERIPEGLEIIETIQSDGEARMEDLARKASLDVGIVKQAIVLATERGIIAGRFAKDESNFKTTRTLRREIKKRLTDLSQ